MGEVLLAHRLLELQNGAARNTCWVLTRCWDPVIVLPQQRAHCAADRHNKEQYEQHSVHTPRSSRI